MAKHEYSVISILPEVRQAGDAVTVEPDGRRIDVWSREGIDGRFLPRANPARRVEAALYWYVGGGADHVPFFEGPKTSDANLAQNLREIADLLEKHGGTGDG